MGLFSRTKKPSAADKLERLAQAVSGTLPSLNPRVEPILSDPVLQMRVSATSGVFINLLLGTHLDLFRFETETDYFGPHNVRWENVIVGEPGVPLHEVVQNVLTVVADANAYVIAKRLVGPEAWDDARKTLDQLSAAGITAPVPPTEPTTKWMGLYPPVDG